MRLNLKAGVVNLELLPILKISEIDLSRESICLGKTGAVIYQVRSHYQ
ncbi:hypothetical protein [Nostoc sp. T09]|nr:hypothetical protein [Nostoc sp. T09]